MTTAKQKRIDKEKKEKMKLEAIKDYRNSKEVNNPILLLPKDWLTDTELKLCSYATKGVWIDMLCYMHLSDPYGFLVAKNKILDEDDIRKLFDKQNGEFDLAWEELNRYGIIKQIEENGAYYSKRLVADYNKREEAKKDNIYINIKQTDSAKEIVTYLNEKTGKKYDSTLYRTVNNIAFWINKGYTILDFKKVIDIKYNEWHKDEKYAAFVRPETLFGDKFESYLNQSIERIKSKEEEVFDKIDEEAYVPKDFLTLNNDKK